MWPALIRWVIVRIICVGVSSGMEQLLLRSHLLRATRRLASATRARSLGSTIWDNGTRSAIFVIVILFKDACCEHLAMAAMVRYEIL